VAEKASCPMHIQNKTRSIESQDHGPERKTLDRLRRKSLKEQAPVCRWIQKAPMSKRIVGTYAQALSPLHQLIGTNDADSPAAIDRNVAIGIRGIRIHSYSPLSIGWG
jgi:hypothetical protein